MTSPLSLLPCLLTVAQLVAQVPAADPLVGIWASETTFGPPVRGELTVTREQDGWRATVGGIEVAFPVNHDSVRFSLPGGLGQFRGSLVKGAIAGFWVEPAGVVQSQPYASPLTLRPVRRDVWRGSVVPLDDQFSLYLVVWRDTTGELRGAFRNPERNSRGGASCFHVVHDADSVRFHARPDTSAPEIRLAAAFDTTRKQLTLWWPDLERPLVLTPRTTEQSVGLYPRVPRGQRYHYRVPPPEADGWTSARAAAVGFDEAALERLIQRIVDTEPTGPRAPLIHSLLVARHGRLVLEEYFFGFARARPHDTRSAAKTFASVMLGAAMLQGRTLAPETPVYALMKREGASSHPDPRKQRITVAHLLTHSSGLACDDGDDASPGNENTMQAQADQPDWWTYTLDLPMGTDPGTHYAYCSGGMNLVGGALTAATGEWLPELFDRTLARPLEFGPYYYNLMPTLEGYAGGGVALRPRDLLKVGQAYLDGGVWRGRRIVAAAWVARSTARQINGPYGPDGFAWHLNTLHPRGGNRDYREYEANGNGGQLLIVLPELDLAVVFTAGNYMNGGVWTKFRSELVGEVIIPAVRR